MVRVLNLETKAVENWSIEEVLKEINRDRSEMWQDYDSSDWREGWLEFVEGDFYSLVEEAAQS